MYASVWMDALWAILVGVCVVFGIYGVGLALLSYVLIVLAVVVYPFRFLRRAYRVLRATTGEFDHDGYRMARSAGVGFHYGGSWPTPPIYPLGNGWPERRDSFHGEPLWCVTSNYSRDRFRFCKRDGSSFRRMPRALRDLDPGAAFRKLDEAATTSRWGTDEDSASADEWQEWERPIEPDRTPMECPHCGRTCIGKTGFLQRLSGSSWNFVGGPGGLMVRR